MTKALGPGGKEIGTSSGTDAVVREWLHSDYTNPQQLPIVSHAAPDPVGQVPPHRSLHRCLGSSREGAHPGGYFCRGELFYAAHAEFANRQELERGGAADGVDPGRRREQWHFCRGETGTSQHSKNRNGLGNLRVQVLVNNLTGHKMPTAYPSRSVRGCTSSVRDAQDHKIFESGGVEGVMAQIEGNHNDTDPTQFEPHYREIATETIWCRSPGRSWAILRVA